MRKICEKCDSTGSVGDKVCDVCSGIGYIGKPDPIVTEEPIEEVIDEAEMVELSNDVPEEEVEEVKKNEE